MRSAQCVTAAGWERWKGSYGCLPLLWKPLDWNACPLQSSHRNYSTPTPGQVVQYSTDHDMRDGLEVEKENCMDSKYWTKTEVGMQCVRGVPWWVDFRKRLCVSCHNEVSTPPLTFPILGIIQFWHPEQLVTCVLLKNPAHSSEEHLLARKSVARPCIRKAKKIVESAFQPLDNLQNKCLNSGNSCCERKNAKIMKIRRILWDIFATSHGKEVSCTPAPLLYKCDNACIFYSFIDFIHPTKIYLSCLCWTAGDYAMYNVCQ